MYRTLIRLVLLIVASLLLVSCATFTAFKPAARSVNQAARAACEATFGEQSMGLSRADIAKLCQEHERLQPFIEAILSARREVGVDLGEAPQGE